MNELNEILFRTRPMALNKRLAIGIINFSCSDENYINKPPYTATAECKKLKQTKSYISEIEPVNSELSQKNRKK